MIDTAAVAAFGGRRTPRSGRPQRCRSATSASPAASRPTQLTSSGGGCDALQTQQTLFPSCADKCSSLSGTAGGDAAHAAAQQRLRLPHPAAHKCQFCNNSHQRATRMMCCLARQASSYHAFVLHPSRRARPTAMLQATPPDWELLDRMTCDRMVRYAGSRRAGGVATGQGQCCG